MDKDLKSIKEQNKILDEIKKKVEEYLEEKRKEFARFYFLSSDELLDLLSFQDKLEIVVDNLKKFFDNIFAITYAEDDAVLGIIKTLVSEEKEHLILNSVVQTKGVSNPINVWLTNMEKGMMDTLKDKM